jgi:hypothetical protein
LEVFGAVKNLHNLFDSTSFFVYWSGTVSIVAFCLEWINFKIIFWLRGLIAPGSVEKGESSISALIQRPDENFVEQYDPHARKEPEK